MKNIIIGIIALGIFVLIGMSFGTRDGALGSIIDGQGYNATSTAGYTMTAGTKVQLKSTSGIFGSVVIASTTAALTGSRFRIMNATSTTDVASTTIAEFGDSTPSGTYTYDVQAGRGIIIESLTAFAGGYTITWK